MLNITHTTGGVTQSEREKITGQRGKVLWFTGLSGSGKSTVAIALEQVLTNQNKLTVLLDGDDLRFGICAGLNFSEEDRFENIRRIAHTARLIKQTSAIVLVSAITPLEKMRNLAREIVGEDFYEIFVDTPLEKCIERDPKGLYKKALNGEISDFTGISAKYEPPKHPDLTIRDLSVSEAVSKVSELL